MEFYARLTATSGASPEVADNDEHPPGRPLGHLVWRITASHRRPFPLVCFVKFSRYLQLPLRIPHDKSNRFQFLLVGIVRFIHTYTHTYSERVMIAREIEGEVTAPLRGPPRAMRHPARQCFFYGLLCDALFAISLATGPRVPIEGDGSTAQAPLPSHPFRSFAFSSPAAIFSGNPAVGPAQAVPPAWAHGPDGHRRLHRLVRRPVRPGAPSEWSCADAFANPNRVDCFFYLGLCHFFI